MLSISNIIVLDIILLGLLKVLLFPELGRNIGVPSTYFNFNEKGFVHL